MDLLKHLYKLHSPSGSEKKLRKYIKDWIRKNVPEALFESDSIGNLYVKKGYSDTYPCLVAHMDQVQKTHSKDFQVVETNEILFGFSLSNVQMEGLGADDKNGIWIALKCLQKFDSMKCCFFVQEEVGCIGSSKCDMTFFTDCRYVLQCDRRGGNDLIPNIGGWTELCSKDFLAAIDYEVFGFKTTTGMMTDVETLKNRGLAVSELNISVGYHRPHNSDEYTVKSELWNTLAFVEHIIETCLEVYPHEEELGYYGGLGSLYQKQEDFEEELWDMVADFIFTYPDCEADDVIYEFEGYGGATREQLETIFEDVKSLYF